MTAGTVMMEQSADGSFVERIVPKTPIEMAETAVGAVGPQGPAGAAGDPGTAGVKGDPGSQGSQGPAGDTGGTGPAGLQGPAGTTGAKGDTGAASTVPGPKGDTGSQGIQGVTGPAGDLGPQGIQGVQGIQGPQGTAGAAGDVSLCWPIGSVFTSVVSTNPATLLGFGTWSAIAAGRVLVGLDSGDAKFDTVEEEGGDETVQSSAQSFAGDALATHQHDAITAGTPAGTVAAISATQTSAGKKGTSTAELATNAHTHPAPAFTGTAMGMHQHAAITAGTPSGTNTPGAATSVVQPYFVCYFWKRTA